MTEFKTIHQAAQDGILPEKMLRRMVHEGKCPGVYSGSRFYINMDQLEEQLAEESRRTASG